MAIDSRSIVLVEEEVNGTRIKAVDMTGEGIVRMVKEPLHAVVNAMTVLEQGLYEDPPDTSWVDTKPSE